MDQKSTSDKGRTDKGTKDKGTDNEEALSVSGKVGLNWKKETYKEALCLLKDELLDQILEEYWGFSKEVLDQLEDYLDGQGKTIDWWESQTNKKKIEIFESLNIPPIDDTRSGRINREHREDNIKLTIKTYWKMFDTLKNEGMTLVNRMIESLRDEFGEKPLRAAEDGENGDSKGILEIFYFIALIFWIRENKTELIHGIVDLPGSIRSLFPRDISLIEDIRGNIHYIGDPKGSQIGLRKAIISYPQIFRYSNIIDECESIEPEDLYD